MHKSSKKRNTIVSLLLVAALAITGAFAYLTATDIATNLFTVGNVVVELTEPNWAPDTDSDDDGINDTMSNIVAGQTIAKDPTITNKGDNDAYVYIMVEIPKVYETEITGADGSAATQTHYPLFSFEANDGWSLIDSQVGTEDDAYDYYLYAYDTALTPNGEATLFDEVKFANITDNFVNTITGEANVDLDIKVTGYAIQSDYYNGEATDAKSAWNLYATQNDWAWPENPYEGLSTLNYLNEDNVLVYSETNYTGTPVEMYFEPSLAKQGYTFDWVDTETSEIAYSGMLLPEGKTDLMATYEGNGFESESTSDYIRYAIRKNANGELYAAVTGLDDQAETYPTSPATVIIPTEISFTATGKEGVQPSENGLVLCEESLAITLSGNITVPVTAMFEYDRETLEDDPTVFVGNCFDSGDAAIIEKLVIPDSIVASERDQVGCMFFENGIPDVDSVDTDSGETFYEAAYGEGQVAPILTDVVLPYKLETIGLGMFMGCMNLKEIKIPNTVTAIDTLAFYISGLEKVEIPDSVKTIGNGSFGYNQYMTECVINDSSKLETIDDYAFDCCVSLESINIPCFVSRIGVCGFSNCKSLTDVDFKKDGMLKTIDVEAFSCANIIGVLELPDAIEIVEDKVFRGNVGITEIILGKNAKTIETQAFDGCSSLENITFSNVLERIDNLAFADCNNLTSVTLPDTVTSVGYRAFYCDGLLSASVPSACVVDSQAFPSSCVITYR